MRFERIFMPFSDVIGHRRLIGLLARSVSRDSLPPSLIFAGPSGIGKRLVALSTAQALNCTSRLAPSGATAEIDACGVCAACRRIARAMHPDVLLVEPGEKGSIKIEQVRDIVDCAAYRPFEGRRRVMIVDDADALVVPAQNALLKTLEEPPPSSVFILVTSRPDVLLPTVRSRCHHLRFRPLGPREIAAALVARGHSEDEANAVAASADGSLGRALEASAGDVVKARDVAQQVLAHAASADDPRRRLDAAKDLYAKTGRGGTTEREQMTSHLHAMASLLRDVELLSTRADTHALANPDIQPALERLVRVYEGKRGVRAFTAVDQALVALERNAGVKIVADWLVLQL
jgi:DNA polymerase-3 subunit delta'